MLWFISSINLKSKWERLQLRSCILGCLKCIAQLFKIDVCEKEFQTCFVRLKVWTMNQCMHSLVKPIIEKLGKDVCLLMELFIV